MGCAVGLLLGWLALAGAAWAVDIDIVSWNVYRYDDAGTAEHNALLRIVQGLDPDVLLIQEGTGANGRTHFLTQFHSRYPYHVLGLPDETTRSHIASSYPITANGEVFAEDGANPPALFSRPTIWADLDVDADGTADLRVYAAHYKSGSAGTDAQTRLNQAAADNSHVAAYLAQHPGGRVFFGGDLNAEPGDPLFATLTSNLSLLSPVDPNNSSPVTRPASGKTIDYLLHSSSLAGGLGAFGILNTATGTPPAPALSGDSALASDHLTLYATLSLTPSGDTPPTPTPADVRINEVFTDHAGTDTVEFVELFGPPGISLANQTLLVIEGDDGQLGTIDNAWPLTGAILPADGLYVVGTAATPRLDLNVGTTNLIENGTITVLLVEGFTGNEGDDLDADNDGVIDAGYAATLGTIIDGIGLLDDDVATDRIYGGVPAHGPAFRFLLDTNPAGAARKRDGLDTDSANDWCLLSYDLVPPAAGSGSDGLINAAPGLHNAYNCASLLPRVIGSEISLDKTSDPDPPAIPIALLGDGGLDYIITSLPAGYGPTPVVNSGGTLIDPGTGLPIAAVPYTLVNAGSTVNFKPATNATGWFAFTFKGSTGTQDSVEARVDIFIQDAHRAIITEIMYDPSSRPDPPGAPAGSGEADWEWIEVLNLTGNPIGLHSLLDNDLNTQSNLLGRSLPASAIRVIVKPENGDDPNDPNVVWWDVYDWLAEWSLTLGDVLTLRTNAGANLPKLGNSGDVVRLFAADGALLDAVRYNAGSGGWPAPNNRGSIYLLPEYQTTTGNDLGANWRLTQPGACGAVTTPDAPGEPADSDDGTPGWIPPSTCGEPPVAVDGVASCNQDASPGIVIDLVATDVDTLPANLTYAIVGGPVGVAPTTGSGGTLTDPNAAEADVTTGGTLAAAQVRFTPAAGRSGRFTFTFKANDGLNDSNFGTITCWVQSTGRVVITEIMYNPANTDTQWEWIELHNLTGAAVDLHTLYDAGENTAGNLVGLTLPANATALLAKGDISGGRTLADFIAEWSPLNGAAVLAVPEADFPSLNAPAGPADLDRDGDVDADPQGAAHAVSGLPADPQGAAHAVSGLSADPLTVLDAADLPALNNTGDSLKLISADGDLLDVVVYENAANGWPDDNGIASIYLPQAQLNTFANDAGNAWQLSVAGYANAYASDHTDSIFDVGSPALLPGPACSPTADDASAQVAQDSATGVIITLTATDCDTPPAGLSFAIATGPVSGSLKDPLAAEADVTAGGPLAGNQVRYIPPPGVSGQVTFTFTASDGSNTSAPGTLTVTILPPLADQVVITEIMYNPANSDTYWEWVEVANITNVPVTLGSLLDLTANTSNNVNGQVLQPGEVKVITRGEQASRPLADFLNAWSLTGPQVLATTPAGAFPSLNNTGDTLSLYNNLGQLLDQVVYQNAAGGWPDDDGFASIYLLPDHLTTAGNDTGSHWALSQTGQAQAITATGGDIGSPGALPTPPAVPPVVTAVKSSKVHGGAGTFDINTETATGTECRSGGPTTVVLTFDQNIQQVSNTVADVTVSSGTVSGLSVSGADLTITMSGATNPSQLIIAFPGIAAATDIGAVSTDTTCMLVLTGDVDGNKSVTIFDLLAVRQVLNQAVTGVNFRRDVVANGGTIAIFDLLAVRQNLNKNVAACP